LIELESSRQIFEKYSNIKFHETPPSGSRVVPCGQTDRRADPCAYNKVRELIAVKLLHTSLLNTTVVAFKVIPLGSYAPMPVPSPPFTTILDGKYPNILPTINGSCITTMHLLTRHCL